MLVRKADTVEEETKWAEWITSTINPHMWQLTGMSLYASLLQEISAATDHLCQIVLNQKFSGAFGSGLNFEVTLKWNHVKIICIK